MRCRRRYPEMVAELEAVLGVKGAERLRQAGDTVAQAADAMEVGPGEVPSADGPK